MTDYLYELLQEMASSKPCPANLRRLVAKASMQNRKFKSDRVRLAIESALNMILLLEERHETK